MIFPIAFWSNVGVVSPTPLLWWKLNHGSGATIAAANGPAGTTDAAWVTGKSGSGFALDFNGSSYATSITAVDYDSANVITVAFWAYLDSTTDGRIVAESSPSGAGEPDSWGIVVANDEIVAHVSDSNVGLRSEKFTAPATGAWNHYACVFNNAAGAVNVFLNGAVQATSTEANDHGVASTFAGNSLFVGARNSGSVFYDGRLDDFRIYSGELTGAQIGAIMADPQ